jgi:putative PIN family toxin of toxin-antitoxin system
MVLDRHVLLVLSEETISELYRKTSQKRYLIDRISPNSVDELVASLREISTIVVAPIETTSAVTRDPKDDYLLAPEIVSRVDHIVTGDRDLLEYTGVDKGFIMTAAAFLQMLDVEPTNSPTPSP